MKDTEAHVEHYSEDNSCNRCAVTSCRDRPSTYFRQCTGWRKWFADRWQGYQIVAEKIKNKQIS